MHVIETWAGNGMLARQRTLLPQRREASTDATAENRTRGADQHQNKKKLPVMDNNINIAYPIVHADVTCN